MRMDFAVRRLAVQIEFTRKQIGIPARTYARNNWKNTFAKGAFEYPLQHTGGAGLQRDLDATNLEINPGISHGDVVGKAVKVDRDPFAIDQPDQFK